MAEEEVLDAFEADGTQLQRLVHCGMVIVEAAGQEHAQSVKLTAAAGRLETIGRTPETAGPAKSHTRFEATG